jgi:hypothetical protein
MASKRAYHWSRDLQISESSDKVSFVREHENIENIRRLFVGHGDQFFALKLLC